MTLESRMERAVDLLVPVEQPMVVKEQSSPGYSQPLAPEVRLVEGVEESVHAPVISIADPSFPLPERVTS